MAQFILKIKLESSVWFQVVMNGEKGGVRCSDTVEVFDGRTYIVCDPTYTGSITFLQENGCPHNRNCAKSTEIKNAFFKQNPFLTKS